MLLERVTLEVLLILAICSLPGFIIGSCDVTPLAYENLQARPLEEQWIRTYMEHVVASGDKEQRKRGAERMGQIIILVS